MTERKVKLFLQDSKKLFFQDSKKLFASLFRKKDNNNENLSLLLEAWKLRHSKMLSDGMIVLDAETKKGEMIFALTDFKIGRTYITEKGNRITRKGDELVLGEKIRIPITAPQSNNDDNSLRGIFHPRIAEVALEFFTRSKLDDGIPLQEENSYMGKIVFAIQDMEIGKLYICTYNSDGIAKLRRLKSDEVEFHFAHSISFIHHMGECLISKQTGLGTPPSHKTKGPKPITLILPVSVANKENVDNARQSNFFEANENDLTPTKRRKYESTDDPLLSPSFEKTLKSPVQESKAFKESEDLIDFNDANEEAEGGLPPPPPPPPPAAPPLPPMPLSSRFGTSSPYSPNSKKRKLRTLKWTPLPDSKIRATFWQNNRVAVPLEENVNKDLEELFSLSPVKSSDKSQSAQTQKKTMNVIDLKRASNIGIIISHFKLSFSEIREALLELDEEVLTVERLLALKSAFPNDEERKKLAAFKGDKSSLSRPEQFLLEMIVVPRLESRVEYLLLKQQFSTLISELSDSIECYYLACEEVRVSEKFSKMLKLVLALGSVLNEGTYLSTNGFKLESLLTLADTKSKNQRTTLLHYLINLIRSRIPELLTFYDELPHVEYAAKIELNSVIADIKSLNLKVNTLGLELNKGTSEEKQNDMFFKKFSQFFVEASQENEKLVKRMDELLVSFKNLATYYGEDNPSEFTAKGFFGNIEAFINTYQRVVKETAKQKSTKRKI